MKLVTKIFAGTFLIMSATSAFATRQLQNYEELVQAVNQGDEVKAIVQFEKCVPYTAGAKLDAEGQSGRFNFNIFSHYKVKDKNKGERFTVATSVTMLTEHPTLGFVSSYGRLRVFDDNTASLFGAYFDPQTYAKKASFEAECRMDNGALVLLDTSN